MTFAPYGPRFPLDLDRLRYVHPGYYVVHDAMCDYTHDRLLKKGKDVFRAWTGFNRMLTTVMRPEDPADKITTGQIEEFIEFEAQAGLSVLTTKRELTFLSAALHYAQRRNRIKDFIHFEMPEGEGKERIPLTEDQFKVVISKPMSLRLNRFYWSAYHSGHRSGAIEEWTWDRCDLVRNVANFNVPGRPLTNKRRCADFPIAPDFRALLLQWKAAAPSDDPFVIGRGVTTTWKEANYVVRVLCGITDPRIAPRHCMRAMYATEMFSRGVDAEIVGHLMADRPDTLRAKYVKYRQEVLMKAALVRSSVPA